jgi:transketolase
VFALLGDGELQCGLVWEAALFAAQMRLSNLTYVIDNNGFQFTGPVATVLHIDPLPAKWQSFGWDVFEVDGHDVEALHTVFTQPARALPRVVIAKTVKGKGVSFMENAKEWHGRAPTRLELEAALDELRL